MVARDELLGPGADGNKIFMVGMELVTTLFALLYAFPHIPTSIVDNVGRRTEFAWRNITSTETLRSALLNLLQTSDVLEASLAPVRAGGRFSVCLCEGRDRDARGPSPRASGSRRRRSRSTPWAIRGNCRGYSI